MQLFKCIIVDDEPIARLVVRNYVLKIGNIDIIKECKNAFEAFEVIKTNPLIDIVFLDINMPNLSGVELVKTLDTIPQVIFTTAYNEYAVESYTINAVDYLLKPFSFERFEKAVLKAKDNIVKIDLLAQSTNNTLSEQTILIKSEGKTYPVKVADILFCEAMKNYTKVYLISGERLLPLVSISKIESNLCELSNHFIKTHRSFIVNKLHVKLIDANNIIFENNKVPIGSQYKEEFLQKLNTI